MQLISDCNQLVEYDIIFFTEVDKNNVGVAASSQETSYEVTADDIDADVKVIKDLYDLEDVFSNTMTDTRKDLKDCDIEEVQFYLDDLVGVDEFRECKNIDEVLRKLRHDRIDTFNINYLKCLISRFHQDKAIVQKIEKYEEKKEEFLRDTTVKQFQQAVVSKAEAVTPKGMAKVTIKIPKEYGVPRTMKDVEELAIKGFKECKKDLVKIEVKPGSVIITWLVPEDLYGELVRLTRENIAVLREKGVEEVSIVGKKSVTISTQDGCEVRISIIKNSNSNSFLYFFKTCRSIQILMVRKSRITLHACICQYIYMLICSACRCTCICNFKS